MRQLAARGLRTLLIAACGLAAGASVALAQSAPVAPSLESISSEASRYSILADAVWAMGLNDLPERFETTQAAVAANPGSAEAHLRLGLSISLEQPRAVGLIKGQYEEALRLDPTLLRTRALLGELLSAEGDAEGVERNYQAWLAVAPNDPGAHLSYAVALARLERLAEAGVELERSLALKPTAAAYLSKAMMPGEASHEAILANLDRALATGGGEARIYRWRATMRRAWGESDLALADVAKALEYAPNSFRLRQLRGQIYSDIGRHDLALAEFDALIASQPGWPDLLNARCWTRAMAGVELAKALIDCDTVLGWEPGRPEALDSRGLVKLRLGDLPGAIADYDAALKDYPDAATSLFGRGLAKRRSGDKTGGDADLDSARALDPKIEKQFESFGVKP